MTSLVVPRGPVTDSLLDFIATQLEQASVPILVGDGERPAGGGWAGAEPGQGEFAAYVTVATSPGVPPAREAQVLSGQHSGWTLSYRLAHYGGSRTQTDWCADKVRTAVVFFDTDSLPAEFGWAVESVVYPALGPVARNDATSPPEWSITEDVQIRVTRARRS